MTVSCRKNAGSSTQQAGYVGAVLGLQIGELLFRVAE